MNRTVTAALVVAVSATLCATAAAQPAMPAADWGAWKPLVGEWVADATPDGATGGSSFALELQGRVLVRKNFADYAKTKQRHDDLMVIYQEHGSTRADYWDNEGHVIHYVATVGDGGKRFTFVSDAGAGPRFRLTYVVTGARTLGLSFEIAPPGSPEAWKPYIQASVHRK